MLSLSSLIQLLTPTSGNLGNDTSSSLNDRVDQASTPTLDVDVLVNLKDQYENLPPIGNLLCHFF